MTCYTYDGLHRKTGATYPSGPNSSSTLPKTFVYDTTTFSCTANTGYPNGAYVQGRLAEAFTGPSAAKVTDIAYCYSPRGEISDEFESTLHSNGTYHTTGSYFANGALSALKGVPAHSGWTFGVDGEGRPNQAMDGSTTLVPLNGVDYNAASQPTGVSLGSGDSDTYNYDPNTGRMNLYEYNIGSTPKLVAGNLTWNPNGSLGSLVIADAFNPANAQNCGYTYDDLSRLASVSCGTTWGQTFSYDAFGNINKTGSGSFASTYYPIVGQSGSPTNNQEQTVSSCAPVYDANGNLTTDCTFIPSNTYAWDADGNLIGINNSTITITYDAFDRAVEQDDTGTFKEILYSPIGKLAVMSHQIATNVYLPLPGGEQATYTGSTIRFRHYDWQGSSRFESNESRQEYADLAYAPFGEPYSIKGAPTTPYRSFTGQNQDTTPGLYDFLYREYNPGQGRWLSPDPSGLSAVDMTNPQSWNRYTYALNNPLSNIDPTGLECVWDDGSYDSNNDPDTGDYTGCTGLGGAWVDHAYFATFGLPDWSGAANSYLAALANQIQNGSPDVTVYGTIDDCPATSPGVAGLLPRGAGVLLNGELSGGVGSVGGIATGAYGTGVYVSNSGQVSGGGGWASGGATLFAGGNDVSSPQQSKIPPFALGAYAGGGGGVYLSNAQSQNQLKGPFAQWNVNIGFGPGYSFSFAYDNISRIWILSATNGPGVGLSGTALTTNTAASSGGCH